MRTGRISDAKTLGLILREARMRRGITQRDLAEDMAVTQRYVVELERGKPTKAIERLLDFARQTGVSFYAEVEDG